MRYLLCTCVFLLAFINLQAREIIFFDELAASPIKHGLTLGEKLTYQVHFGMLQAGEVVMQIDKKLHTVNQRPCYHLDVYGESKGALYLLLKIKNHFGSYLDTVRWVPQEAYRFVQERAYRKNEKLRFDHQQGVVHVEELDVTGNQVIANDSYLIGEQPVQDIVSNWYVLRNVNFKDLKVGDVLCSAVFFDHVVHNPFKVKYLGRRTIKTKLGTMKTLVLAPLVPFASTGKSIFAGERSVELFLSDDAAKIPVKIKIKLLVGAVEMDLVHYEGVEPPLAIQKVIK
eukprot:gene186-247_t